MRGRLSRGEFNLALAGRENGFDQILGDRHVGEIFLVQQRRLADVDRLPITGQIVSTILARGQVRLKETPAIGPKLAGRFPDLLRRRQWRSTRQSPPKCITCGSTDVIILSGESTLVPGLGQVDLSVLGMCSSEGDCCHFWYFTPEGCRIPEPLD